MRAHDALERRIQRKSREPGEPTDANARARATSPKLPRTCAVGGSTHAFNAFTNDRFNSTNRGPPVAGCGAASSTSMPWSVDIFEFKSNHTNREPTRSTMRLTSVRARGAIEFDACASPLRESRREIGRRRVRGGE